MKIRLFLAVALLTTALGATAAHAEPNESDRATARALANEGYRALKRGDYAVAADRFQRADALVHAPTLVVDWARALKGLGSLVEAEEKYTRVLREGIPASAPRSWALALSDAQSEIEALRPRIAWLTLDIYGPEQPVVTVDGVRLPAAALGVPRATNPGMRAIRVEAEGYVPETRSLKLPEGARERVEITLVAKPAGFATAAPARRLAPAPRSAHDEDPDHGFAYAALAVGGVGLAFGGVTGALALNKRAKLDEACHSESCPPSSRDDIDAYHRLGIASGIGFGVGVLGVGTGITLLLTQSSGSPAVGRRPLTRQSREARLTPYVGLGSIGAAGAF